MPAVQRPGAVAGRLRGGLAALIAVAAALLAPPATASLPYGVPPVSHFKPDLDVYPQNFAIAQDAQSILYLGNSDGILIYDGSRWQLLNLPNNDHVRSLAHDGAGRVYAGGFDVFGYVERDANGEEHYRDLTPLARQLVGTTSFADIWDIHISPRGVFFRATQHVFLYEPRKGSMRVWEHAGRFGAIREFQGSTLLQFRGEGLKRLKGDRWELLPGSAALKEQIYQLLSLPGNGLLTVARDGTWREFRDGEVRDYAMPAGTPPSSNFTDAYSLADHRIVLSTDDGKIAIFDPVSRRLDSFQIATGMLAGLVRANDGGLLTADDQGAIHVAWPSAWSAFDTTEGLDGRISALRRFGADWYALTDDGVFQVTSEGGQTRFLRRNWTEHESWELLDLGDGSALLADSYLIKLVDRNGARAITHGAVYPNCLLRSRYDPDIVYVGTDHGLAILQRRQGRWQLRLDPSNAAPMQVTGLVELSEHEVWLGTERDGVQRLRIRPDHSVVDSQEPYGPQQGVEYGRIAVANLFHMPDGQLLASTSTGLYQWNGTRFARTPLDGLDAARSADEDLQFAAADNGDLWAYSYRHLYRRSGQQPWQQEPIGNLLVGGLQSVSFADGGATAIFVTGESLLQHRALSDRPSTSAQVPQLALRAVERLDPKGGLLMRLPLAPDQPPRFTRGEFTLSFRYALPDYQRANGARYQVRLVGLRDVYPEWSESRQFTVIQLDPGTYRFEARARDSLGRITELTPYSFIVLPDWYASPWALVLWTLLGLFLLWMFTRWLGVRRTLRLTRENEQLEEIVSMRTRELAQANQRLDLVAHMDGLTEIANRRRLNAYLDEAWDRCRRDGRPLAVIVLDVDNFKKYNDHYGHLAGDDVLRQVGQILSRCMRRPEDLAARYGGDEFVVVLPDTDLDTAAQIAESARRSVEDIALGTTISLGVAAEIPSPEQPPSNLVYAADAALYEAKRAGRNRVARYSPRTTMPPAGTSPLTEA